MKSQDLNVILATDCGSTTTKAILIQKRGQEYCQTHRGEAPTTVEAPFEDVTRGVLNAIQEVKELSGRTILDGERILHPGPGRELCQPDSSGRGGSRSHLVGAEADEAGLGAARLAARWDYSAG